MIPIRPETRPPIRPWTTWALIALCVAALVRLASLPAERAVGIFEALAVVPRRFLSLPWDPAQALTLISSAFLHAGWVHLAGNMLYLLVFGPLVEWRLGRARFLALYLAAGAAGALLHVAVFPTSDVPLVGASAAIAGVLGAHLVLEPRARVTTVIPVIVFFELASLPAWFVIALWFALQLASALASISTAAVAGATTVAWFAHLGGFAIGALAAAVHRTGRQSLGKKRRARTGPRRSAR